MPELHFRVRWPDGSVEDCYSPSTIVTEHLATGVDYPLARFVEQARAALEAANGRVRARFGMGCAQAINQLAAIERTAAAFTDTPGATVRVEGFAPCDLQKPAEDTAMPVETLKTPPRQHVPVLIVGGGQGGLSLSYLLKEQGIDHLILEKDRIGHSWRTERWDSFCLVTPNRQCRLPGFSYAGEYRGADPHGFMLKDEIIAFLESYAAMVEPPIREGVAVTGIAPRQGGGFEVCSTEGIYTADRVIVAISGYHTPIVPRPGAAMPASVLQVQSLDYRNPQDLPEGEILVIGSGQSGCQIAEDLHLAGRKVHLAVGDAPRAPRQYRGRDSTDWLEEMGHYDMPIDDHPSSAKVRQNENHYLTGRDGGREIDLRKFALEGMKLYGMLAGIDGHVIRFQPDLTHHLDIADATYVRIRGTIDAYIAREGIDAPVEAPYEPCWVPPEEPLALDLAASNIAAVIWCTGFRMDFGFVEVPVFDGRGYPAHQRGVSAYDGLYFIGLPWLHTWGSGRFAGVARDAAHIVDHIAAAAVPSGRRAASA